jgi:hypothetical protein
MSFPAVVVGGGRGGGEKPVLMVINDDNDHLRVWISVRNLAASVLDICNAIRVIIHTSSLTQKRQIRSESYV